MAEEQVSGNQGNRWYWIAIVVFSFGLVLAELVFGDLLIDKEAKSLTSLTKISAVLISGSAVALFLTGMLKRYLLSQVPKNADGIGGRPLSPRSLSVIPLIRGILLLFILVLTLLVALSELGVNIGPILAGAGAAGIILGLGAQSLLKDILAGIFYIIDDAFRLGEYVEVGNLMGTVERISLRSMQIRHHRGPLQTIPYGSIQAVVNHSRDWVIVKLPFELPHDTDILKVKKIVKAISNELMQEDYYSRVLIEPPKFQGIQDVDLYGLTVRIKFTAVPGEQFVARREIIRRLKTALKENGIEFAKRTVTIAPGAGGAGGAGADADTAAAAAGDDSDAARTG